MYNIKTILICIWLFHHYSVPHSRHDAITCTMMRKLNNNSRIIRRSKRSSPSSTRIVIRTIFLLGSYLYLCNGTPHSATAYRRSDPFDYSGGSSKSTSAFFRNKALTSCIIGAGWYQCKIPFDIPSVYNKNDTLLSFASTYSSICKNGVVMAQPP